MVAALSALTLPAAIVLAAAVLGAAYVAVKQPELFVVLAFLLLFLLLAAFEAGR